MNLHQITCQRFQRQESDWLAGRLSAERSEVMAAHRGLCASCARKAQAESQTRQSWEDGSAAIPAVDLWPRLSVRLRELERTSSPSRRPFIQRFPRWAMGGVVVLTVMAVFGVHQIPLENAMNGRGEASHSPSLPTVSENTVAHPGQSVTWSSLDDVAQNNPSVDDPVGQNMENVWTTIKTSRK